MLQTLLIIDDSPEVIALVDETLRSKYRIQVAISGLQVLKMLDREPIVDLILLDVMIPDMDGFEICRQIKKTPVWCDIPVIFLTSLNENSDEAYGLGLGAVDYIIKPIVPMTLQARVNTHMKLRQISQELQQKNETLRSEREIIEGMIIRMRIDTDFNDRYLRLLIRPVEKTSGDICLATICPDGRQIVLVGDFTGHGLTAAVGGPIVKQAFYSLCAQGVSMVCLLETINNLLFAQLLTSQFMAAHLVEVNSARQRIHLFCGGMPELLYVNPAGEIRKIKVNGLPLGVMSNLDLTEDIPSLSVRTGERFLLYTDGIIEGMNFAEEMYQIDRLANQYTKLLKNNGSLTGIITDFDAFVCGKEQQDDLLLLELTI